MASQTIGHLDWLGPVSLRDPDFHFSGTVGSKGDSGSIGRELRIVFEGERRDDERLRAAVHVIAPDIEILE